MTLKPIAPTKYDGLPDSKASHRFMTEGTAYVKDGGVPSKKRAFIPVHYLTGKAREFYVNAMAVNPYKWKLPVESKMANLETPLHESFKRTSSQSKCDRTQRWDSKEARVT